MTENFSRIFVSTQKVNFLHLRLCCNTANSLDVMLREREASAFQAGSEKADSSAVPQNDILTQSLEGEDILEAIIEWT